MTGLLNVLPTKLIPGFGPKLRTLRDHPHDFWDECPSNRDAISRALQIRVIEWNVPIRDEVRNEECLRRM